MDATTAAKTRIDQALARLERKVMDLKARAAGPVRGDDDLFAALPSTEADQARIAELEAAGQEASEALMRASEQLRELLREAD